MCVSAVAGFNREMLNKLSHCLQKLRRVLEEALRDPDFCERYGGAAERVLNVVRGDADVGFIAVSVFYATN